MCVFVVFSLIGAVSNPMASKMAMSTWMVHMINFLSFLFFRFGEFLSLNRVKQGIFDSNGKFQSH